MSNISSGIARVFRDNSAAMALSIVASRSWYKMKSSVMGFSLRAPGLYLGPGCQVLGGRHISFGKGVYAGRNLWLEAVLSYRSQRFDPKIAIGDYVCFSDGVHISAIESITVGNHTLFGSKIYVSDHNHGTYRGERQSSPEEPPAHRLLGGGGPVIIGENAWIGDNSVILGPTNIGKGAIIAANSVVRGEVAAHTIVAGAPAKPIKFFNFQTGSWDKA